MLLKSGSGEWQVVWVGLSGILRRHDGDSGGFEYSVQSTREAFSSLVRQAIKCEHMEEALESFTIPPYPGLPPPPLTLFCEPRPCLSLWEAELSLAGSQPDSISEILVRSCEFLFFSHLDCSLLTVILDYAFRSI